MACETFGMRFPKWHTTLWKHLLLAGMLWYLSDKPDRGSAREHASFKFLPVTNPANIIPGASSFSDTTEPVFCLGGIALLQLKGLQLPAAATRELCLGNKYIPLPWRNPWLAARSNSPLPPLPPKQTRQLAGAGDQVLYLISWLCCGGHLLTEVTRRRSRSV